jgi:hypothetical protein
MVGYKLTQQDCGSLNREYACVYYRKGETFEAPGNGAYVGLTLNGVMCGGYGPRLVAVEWAVADELGRYDDGVVRVRRGRVLARLPEDAPAWTQAWEGEPEQADACRQLLALGGEENWRFVAGWAARGSAERADACRQLLALGGAENWRCVAERAAIGSALQAQAFRQLLSIGGSENWRCVAVWAARGSAERAKAIRLLE